MKKYLEKRKTIAAVMVVLIACTFLLGRQFKYLHLTVYTLVFVYLAGNSLRKRIHYRKGKLPFHLFPVYNDQYTRITSLTVGAMFVIGAITVLVLKGGIWCTVVFAVVGLSLIAMGFFTIPGGMVWIEGNQMMIHQVHNQVDLRQLKEIELQPSQIILTNIYDENTIITQPVLNAQSGDSLAKYILAHAQDHDLVIRNNTSEGI